jgi:hypothetical protein
MAKLILTIRAPIENIPVRIENIDHWMPSKTQTFTESFGVFPFQQGTRGKIVRSESFTEEKFGITVTSVIRKFDYENESSVSPYAQDLFFSTSPVIRNLLKLFTQLPLKKIVSANLLATVIQFETEKNACSWYK